jgi:enoyl-CoA hydratase/carnithine racemase
MEPELPMVTRDRRYQADDIERVILSHTAKRNALSEQLLSELDQTLVAIEAEQRAKVVILAADGPVFSAGHDLRELRYGAESEVAAVFRTCSAVMGRIRALSALVIAEVEGIATAAGCQLVATADLAVAGSDARFATPGVKIGYFCTTPAVALSRNVGRKQALEMLVTGDFITAQQALSIGLVNRVVPAGQAEAAALELARRIVPYARATLAGGKRDFYRQLAMPDAEALDFASGVMVGNVARPEAREGMSAFLEKRQPVWPG